MATKYISSITLPNGDEARLVDKYSGYTTNTGTVTSVTASGALSSSGGTTPAITHNAPSTSPAKSTQAVYPITIDSYGHITSAGSAVEIPSTNLIILDVSPNLSGDGYTVSFNSDSMSYTDACTAINNGEIVYIELNGSLGMGKYFEEADLFRIFGPDGAIDRITATFITSNSTGTGSSALSCNIVSDSSATLTDINLATSEDISDVTDEAYMPREQLASNTNLNTILTSGCYKLDGTVNYTNAPTISVDCTLSVIKTSESTTTIEQTIKATDNSVRSYIRFSLDNGSTWSDWREEGGYETYESWSSGAHDANSPLLGLVFCRNGSSYTTNLPDSGTYGYLLTQGRIGANCLQTYTGYSSSGVTSKFTRYYANSQWYPWKSVGENSFGEITDWTSGSHSANDAIPGLTRVIGDSSHVTDLPWTVSNAYGYLLTFGSTQKVQFSLRTNSEGVVGFYIRQYNGTSWYPWTLIGPGGSSYNNLDEVSF